MKSKLLNQPFGFVLFLLVLVATGCDERSISPMEESSGTYSIYGALSIDQAKNYVRVRDLTVPFLSDSAKTIDAVVTFEDLEEGTVTTLEDTVVNFSGNYTHNFIVDQQLEPNRSYLLTVERSDGTTVTSTATTPAITQVELSEPVDPDEGEVTAECLTQVTFSYLNVVEPESISMEVGFQYDGRMHWAEVGKVAQLQYREGVDEMFVRMSPRNLLVEVFPPPGIDNPGLDPRFLSPTVGCDELDSDEVHIRYNHFGPEWYNIDRSRGPINPLESRDVEGGLGFLGAYRSGSFSFFIDQPDLN